MRIKFIIILICIMYTSLLAGEMSIIDPGNNIKTDIDRIVEMGVKLEYADKTAVIKGAAKDRQWGLLILEDVEIDFDNYTELVVDVAEISNNAYIRLSNLPVEAGFIVHLSPEITESKKYVYDLKKLNLKGKHKVDFKIGLVGRNKNSNIGEQLVIKSLKLVNPEVPEEKPAVKIKVPEEKPSVKVKIPEEKTEVKSLEVKKSKPVKVPVLKENTGSSFKYKIVKFIDPVSSEIPVFKGNEESGAGMKYEKGKSVIRGLSRKRRWGQIEIPFEAEFDENTKLVLDIAEIKGGAGFVRISGLPLESGFSHSFRPELTESKKYIYDLGTLNLKGKHKVNIEIGVIGAEAGANVKSEIVMNYAGISAEHFEVEQKKIAKEVAEKDIIPDIKTGPGIKIIIDPSKNIKPEFNDKPMGDEEAGAVLKYEDGFAVVQGSTSKRMWGRAMKKMEVDFDKYQKLIVGVIGVTRQGYVIISNLPTETGYSRLDPTILKPGIYEYDLSVLNLRGKQDIVLELGVTDDGNIDNLEAFLRLKYAALAEPDIKMKKSSNSKKKENIAIIDMDNGITPDFNGGPELGADISYEDKTALIKGASKSQMWGRVIRQIDIDPAIHKKLIVEVTEVTKQGYVIISNLPSGEGYIRLNPTITKPGKYVYDIKTLNLSSPRKVTLELGVTDDGNTNNLESALKLKSVYLTSTKPVQKKSEETPGMGMAPKKDKIIIVKEEPEGPQEIVDDIMVKTEYIFDSFKKKKLKGWNQGPDPGATIDIEGNVAVIRGARSSESWGRVILAVNIDFDIYDKLILKVEDINKQGYVIISGEPVAKGYKRFEPTITKSGKYIFDLSILKLKGVKTVNLEVGVTDDGNTNNLESYMKLSRIMLEGEIEIEEVDTTVRRILEIDGFENISPQNIYKTFASENCEIELQSSRQVKKGKFSMSVEYTLNIVTGSQSANRSKGFVSFTNTFQQVIDWSGIDGISLWIKGDGTDNYTRLYIFDETGNYIYIEKEDELKDINWHEIEFKKENFKSVSGNFNWHKAQGYKFEIIGESYDPENGKIWIDRLSISGYGLVKTFVIPPVPETTSLSMLGKDNFNFNANIDVYYRNTPEKEGEIYHYSTLKAEAKVGKVSAELHFNVEEAHWETYTDTDGSREERTKRINYDDVKTKIMKINFYNPFESVSLLTIGNVWIDYSDYLFEPKDKWGFRGLKIEGRYGIVDYDNFIVKHDGGGYTAGVKGQTKYRNWEFRLMGIQHQLDARSAGTSTDPYNLEEFFKTSQKEFNYIFDVSKKFIHDKLKVYFLYGHQNYRLEALRDKNGNYTKDSDFKSNDSIIELKIDPQFIKDSYMEFIYRRAGNNYYPVYRKEPEWFDKEISAIKRYQFKAGKNIDKFYLYCDYAYKKSTKYDHRYASDFFGQVAYSGFKNINLDVYFGFYRNKMLYKPGTLSWINEDWNEKGKWIELSLRNNISEKFNTLTKIKLKNRDDYRNTWNNDNITELYFKTEYQIFNNAKILLEIRSLEENDITSLDDNYLKFWTLVWL